MGCAGQRRRGTRGPLAVRRRRIGGGELPGSSGRGGREEWPAVGSYCGVGRSCGADDSDVGQPRKNCRGEQAAGDGG
ncbi:hypothetical protein GUJ93_ZPchr0011g26931 [Zizania palustris]|uniref:Uncharacterized protein n=1 Tax=Zizania palustris TaxID=103762 RepID=A0A8J5WJL0_ZIZPA|nr:hypothetical protein GUJ93_ZPchr0011g26931 [Zizania palustris]